MLYVASAHPPSAQLGALSLSFFAPEQQTLVVNKLSTLEFYEIGQPDGRLRLVEEVKLHGGVAAMEKVQLPNSPTASLLVLTTSLQLFCLSYSSTSGIQTLSSTSLAEPFARLSEYQTILVSPCGSAASVYAYDGLLRVIPLRPLAGEGSVKAGKKRRASMAQGGSAVGEDGTLDLAQGYNVRVQSLNVLSLAFLPSSASSASSEDEADEDQGEKYPTLAVLATTAQGTRTLTTYTLNLTNKELDESTAPMPEQQLDDAGSEVLIPVQGGVLVVGEESVVFYGVKGRDEKGKGRAGEGEGGVRKVRAKLPVARITAYTHLTSSTLLLGDLYGKLLLLALSPSSITVKDLGDATSPTSIVPLSPSLVYLSSRFGDSQVVRLPNEAGGEAMEIEGEGEKGELELVESYAGLAPIIDAVVLGGPDEEGDSASAAPTSLLLLSGAYKTGSLRLLRRGLGLTPLADLDMEGIRAVFPLLTATGESLLVLAFFGETRVLRVSVAPAEEGGAEEEVDVEELDDLAPFASSAPEAGAQTLLAANVGELLVHVTPAGVFYAAATGGGEGSWTHGSGKKFTAAVAKGERVAVAVEGGEVVLLEAEGGGLKQIGTTSFANDVSSLSLSSTGSHLAVALWTPSQTVHLLALPSLAEVAQHTLTSTFLIRSLSLTTFSASTSTAGGVEQSYLFCGLGDGSLTSFAVSLERGEIDPQSEKTVQLGRRPLVLQEIEQAEGERAVFVASERPTVVSLAKGAGGGRLNYASVNCGDLSSVCPLPLPSSSAAPLLALASPTSLSLSRLSRPASASGSGQGEVDIRTIPLDEDEPRRIAHDRKGACFAVVCSRRDVDRVNGEQKTAGRVRVMEEEGFATRASITLPPQEEGQSACAFRLSSTPATSSLFLVGTTKLDLATPEPTEGRLILLGTTAGSDTLEELASKSVGGCPYAVVSLQGEGLSEYVAAAVNSQVAVFRVKETESGGFDFEVVATWSGAFVALSLAAAPNGTLVVGDALRSIAALRFSLPTGPSAAGKRPKLEELGKDYRSRYMVGVEALTSASGRSEEGETERYIGAETDLNLFTVERDAKAGVKNLADAGTLSAAGAWHLGEMVTRFRPGSFGQLLGSDSSSSSISIKPQLVFATSAGSVGVIVELDSETSKVLSDLERNLRKVDGLGKGVGGLEQEDFRSFKSDKHTSPAAGFIDGTFVEQFLDLSAAQQDEVVRGQSEHETLSLGREEVVRLLEEVARAH
ncbi:hypothetical protein JCM10213_005951 [Rhodosporidiobolus nylandii]